MCVDNRIGGSVLNLDCSHLLSFHSTRTLYKQLELFPQEIIPIMDKVVNEEFALLDNGDFFSSPDIKMIQGLFMSLRSFNDD